MCAADGLYGSGRLNTEYTIQKGFPEAKYTYRVNALHTEPNTPLHMSPCGVWRSAQVVHIQTPAQREYKRECTCRSRNAKDKIC